jgi:hypothetical protein
LDDIINQAADLDIFTTFVTFDLVAPFGETAMEAIEWKGEGGLAWFASTTDTGDEGVVVEAFKAVVDFGKLVVDEGEEVAGTVAADADLDFAVGLVFEDFGAGVVFV